MLYNFLSAALAFGKWKHSDVTLIESGLSGLIFTEKIPDKKF
jgi:hypothetical protein